mmetsp:Transcript_12433/g.23595  ORF Transcript_12433/g.23595 Transcript_12433/m.23595 type:complete len:202 (+) Transcript_12433:306-911(+)
MSTASWSSNTSHKPSLAIITNLHSGLRSIRPTSGVAETTGCAPLNSRSPRDRDTASALCDPRVDFETTRQHPENSNEPPTDSTRDFSSGRLGLWSSVIRRTSSPTHMTARESPAWAAYIAPPMRTSTSAVQPSPASSGSNLVSISRSIARKARVSADVTTALSAALSLAALNNVSAPNKVCKRYAAISAARAPLCPSNNPK